MLTFVSAPDIHNVDSFMDDSITISHPEFDFLLAGMQSFKPHFVLLPGDIGGQRWWETKFQNICAPAGTLFDVIMGCAAITYPRLLDYMANHGFPTVYVALGDHEIGDNNWIVANRSIAVPYFKQAFAKYLTQNMDGSSKFSGLLDNIPMLPVGTPYENTSYAFQYANTLFIVIDEFRQDDPYLQIGRNGSVQLTVGDDGQLQWLDDLLNAARQDPIIQHIIVIGHLPVLSPVRAVSSSTLYLEGQQSSEFWKLLQKHDVDVYFAGEVHNTTVIKDPQSHIMQIVHKGGYINNSVYFLVGRIYENRIEFENQIMKVDEQGNRFFVKESKLVIDKSGGEFRYLSSNGLLKPIQPNNLIVHYSFDEAVLEHIKNYGVFGSSYDATGTNITFNTGILSNALRFNDTQGSVVTSYGISPITGQQPRTISVWFSTTNSAAAYIYPAGQFGGKELTTFRLLLAKGILKLQLNKTTMLYVDQNGIRLNDGKWHHVAVTFAKDSLTNQNKILFYLDGKMNIPITLPTESIFTKTGVDEVNIGGRRNNKKIAGWTGSLDDFAIWTSILSPQKIKAIKTCAEKLNYDASDMESLFKLHRKRSGTMTVKGLNWEYATQMISETGICKKQNGRYWLRLDQEGHGVRTQF